MNPTLRATLEQRIRELGLAHTVEASPTATIKPAERSSEGQTRPGHLPRISIDSSTGGQPSADASAPDLELRQLLGEGGMGRVHTAFQRSLSREVAIKTLRTRGTASAATALLREAVVTGALEHPGVVPIHALGVDASGEPVLVMKRIEGVQWGDLIRDPQHPKWSKRPGDRLTAHVEIAMQVCQTIHFAHTRGVLHRDIKPENVMLGDFGEIYVVDWGIALRLSSVTSDTPFAGTPAYMAPEMVTGAALDARTDVYLLGATLHEALTREPRNRGDTIATVLAAAAQPEPYVYDPTIPTELAAICNRATAAKPEDRFSSADAVRAALASYLHHRGSIALAERAAERCGDLEALLRKNEGPLEDPPGAYRLASEVRFACAEALRTWPENARAHEVLQRGLALVMELELRQGNVDAADAVAREIEKVPPALAEKLERAHSARDAAAEEQRKLRALASDLDARVATRARIIALGTVSIFSIAILTGLLSGVRLDTTRMLLVSLAILFAACVTTVLLRKMLLANVFNRRATAIFMIGAVAMVVGRALAIVERLPVSEAIVHDLLLLTAVVAVGSATLLRWMWLMVPVCVASIAAALLAPEYASFALALTFLLLPFIAGYALHREASRPS